MNFHLWIYKMFFLFGHFSSLIFSLGKFSPQLSQARTGRLRPLSSLLPSLQPAPCGEEYFEVTLLHPLALSSSSMGGVRFALSSTQKVTISPFPFTVTFAKLDGCYATSNLAFGRSTLDNQVVPTHAQTDTWGDISEIPPCLSLWRCRQQGAKPEDKVIFECFDQLLGEAAQDDLNMESHLDCAWNMDRLLLPEAHHPRACVHCITKEAIPGQRSMLLRVKKERPWNVGALRHVFTLWCHSLVMSLNLASLYSISIIYQLYR